MWDIYVEEVLTHLSRDTNITREFKMALRIVPITITTLFLTAGVAAARCPDYAQNGSGHSVSSESLYSETRMSVRAGGGVDLGTCSEAPGVGHVSEAPDFTLNYERTGSYNVRFRSQGNCDTVILINDAAGNWHWDDDTGPDAEVTLGNPKSGYIDVWVGTYGGELCNATLVMESFDR